MRCFSIPILAIGWAVCAGMFYWMICRDKFFTVKQMKAKDFKHGLPGAYHPATWLNPIVMVPLFAYIVEKYEAEWSMEAVEFISAAAIIVAIGLGTFWAARGSVKCPEAYAHGGKPTVAGFLNGILLAGGITIGVLYFLYSNSPKSETAVVGFIFASFVTLCTHILLGLYAPEWYTWRPQKDWASWILIGVSWWLCLVGWKWIWVMIHTKFFAAFIGILVLISVALAQIKNSDLAFCYILPQRGQFRGLQRC